MGVAPAPKDASGVARPAPSRGAQATPPSEGLEGGAQTYPEGSPRRETFLVGDGARSQVRRGAVVDRAVDHVVVHLREAVAVELVELRVVEGVVEQRRKLQPEAVLLDDVLVEREVHDPG